MTNFSKITRPISYTGFSHSAEITQLNMQTVYNTQIWRQHVTDNTVNKTDLYNNFTIVRKRSYTLTFLFFCMHSVKVWEVCFCPLVVVSGQISTLRPDKFCRQKYKNLLGNTYLRNELALLSSDGFTILHITFTVLF
jgi:hypothetical protein